LGGAVRGNPQEGDRHHGLHDRSRHHGTVRGPGEGPVRQHGREGAPLRAVSGSLRTHGMRRRRLSSLQGLRGHHAASFYAGTSSSAPPAWWPWTAPPSDRYCFSLYWMVLGLIPRIVAALVVDPPTASSVLRMASFSICSRGAPGTEGADEIR